MPDTANLSFGGRATAEAVVAGLDLRGRTILVTGCNSGIGYETMRVLAARGAHVIGLARSMAAAREACARAGGAATPIACDHADLGSIVQAIGAVRAGGWVLDAIVGNAGIIGARRVERCYGVERQFWVNHVAHALLVTRLADRLQAQTGRVVMVSSLAGVRSAPRAGILFDDLDGARHYARWAFYGQSKLANALFADELARRLAARGIVANSLHPGVIFGTRLFRYMAGLSQVLDLLARPFTKTVPQGAATQTLLAAHPAVAGITGRYWSDCRPARGSRHLGDRAMATRLWDTTETMIASAAESVPVPASMV